MHRGFFIIDSAAGATCDYFYEIQGIVHSYTIEVRDRGEFGFLLPPTLIHISASELFNGLKAMANAI